MKQKILAMILSVAMIFTMLPTTALLADEGDPAGDEAIVPAPTPTDNLARSAKADAVYTNTYGITTDRINDGTLANATASTSWNCWGAGEELYPMEVSLTWEEAQTMSSMRVMWWSDGGGVDYPTAAEVQYLDGEEWKKISDVGLEHGGTNGADGIWNIVNFGTPISTTSLRLLVNRENQGQGIGISEWEVFDKAMKESISSVTISGSGRLNAGDTATFTGNVLPDKLAEGAVYEWSVQSDGVVEIQGAANEQTVTLLALKEGRAVLHLKGTKDEVSRETDFNIRVTDLQASGVEAYQTYTAAGVAPILPDSVVLKGVEFDDPTPATSGSYDFGEEFNSRLIPVQWNTVDPDDYATVGTSFTVTGTASYNDIEYSAEALISVEEPVAAAESNSSVTFENVQLEDSFWMPRQEINATTSLNKAIEEIAKSTGGEPNFDNAIKKLNGEEYGSFSGYVFQDSDIYKSIEAISYTLSATQNDTSDKVVAQRQLLQEKLDSWIEKIENVQYADGYIDTFFTLRSTSYSGGEGPGTHRWRYMANHEMYNAGHFLESVVAYTRYREGVNDPDYRLYVAGRRFANHIVSLFGPNGTRHEVPGHEEIELALVKFGKLVEEYEGKGSGQKYYDTAKILIDRRGTEINSRESGYYGGVYSQDMTPFQEEENAVGHAVRANYFYTGVTDIATMLPEDDADKDAYISSLDTIWNSVTERKTYITGGIGATTASSSSEGFGADYDLPPKQSYCEICAAIAAANWNQRMNLLHEDGKYADMVEKNLFNSILVGENLDGNLFYYSTLLQADNGNRRSEWFSCACCPPNLMRTIASLSGYIYTVHNDTVFVNMYVGSEGSVNIGGTQVGLKQETNYPWDGAVKMTVSLPDSEPEKEFAMKIRIPGWVKEQENQDVTIRVGGQEIPAVADKGYVTIDGIWDDGDVITIDIPMEVRMTESDPNVSATQGMIALQRGPIVYCMEKAGNAQLNPEISNFSPLNFVIPRDADLKAEYNANLLNGVVEITGDVKYATGNDKEMIDAKLQAIPYYAWNNRGDDADYVAGLASPKNSSSQMLIWTMADEPIVKEKTLNDDATPSVSYVGWGMGAENFADGDEGTFWNGHSDPNLQTQDQWMMYDFGEKRAEITQTDIWFYDDGGGVMTPTGITIEYEAEDGSWKEVTPVGDWAYVKNESYTYKFEKIVTSKIRVTMNHAIAGGSKVAVAVVEWVLGGELFTSEKPASQESVEKLTGDVASAKTDYRETDYTEDSWNVFIAALQKAESVVANADATQTQVDEAQKNLEDAIKQLTEKQQGDQPAPPADDKETASQESVTKLTTAVNAAGAVYKEAEYTPESWKVFSAALDAAKKVIADTNATQTQVDKAQQDLTDAIAKLVKQQVQTPTLPVVKKSTLTLGVKETSNIYKKGYTYSTSNKAYVTVTKKGVVKGVKKGKATITVKNASGQTVQTYTVTVKSAPKKIKKVSPTKKSLKKGKSVTIKVTLPNGTASKITFTSSNKKVATVSAAGVVKAKKKGKATITVKTFNKKTKKIQITVK